MNNFSLTKQDILVMKGIAICAMLCHHLYAYHPETEALQWLGELGKVCVALFLFCSGYGLSVNYNPLSFKDDVKFVAQRLIKFYANYWVIFAIFVPISIFLFHRSLSIPYGENANIPVSLVLDILGLQGEKSYNITWWFNRLIIVLYIVFPIMYRMVQRMPWLMVALFILLIQFENYFPHPCYVFLMWRRPFAFSFVAGIVWQKYENSLPKLYNWSVNHRITFGLLAICGVCIVTVLRMYPLIPRWSDINLDAILTCSIALLVFGVLRYTTYVTGLLAFLGKHSMNIYMMHTFFNAYWRPKWLHTCEWMRGGGNFVVLMVLCLFISLGIEFLKEKIRLYELVQYLKNRI